MSGTPVAGRRGRPSAGEEHREHEPVVVGADRHLAAVLRGDVTDRLDTEPVTRRVALRRAQIAGGIPAQRLVVFGL